jgi:hypothetical protein
MATAVDPVTCIEFDQEQVVHDTERGDLLLIRGDERLLIDVTIVRLTAPSVCSSQHCSPDSQCGDPHRWSPASAANLSAAFQGGLGQGTLAAAA